ncbi:MAG TPA: 4-(cytidine 5'-diphospho)-2-C-methyl-D-erythritol kinase [Bacteroidales bacterium]|nr:4-(cytidine 5'-diphospho)-2-C-methyl-D-erythritol kinase [Bacteroidales bacterium]
MIVYPNCKINLGLNVISRRPDGFHDIESVFYPVPWCDILEIIPSAKGIFTFNGININCPTEKNLCYKAYQLVKKQYHIPDINVYLYKRIPFGAGLGGGSSDGAFTLTLLNELFSLNMNETTLLEMASALGSDCTFFHQNSPCFVTGRGTILQPLTISLKGYHIVIIKPDFAISTQEAYRMISPQKPSMSVRDIMDFPVSDWNKMLMNDFETPVFAKYPQIGQIKEILYQKGAVYSSMSGSGSAVYGLFRKEPEIGNNFQDCITWKGCLL